MGDSALDFSWVTVNHPCLVDLFVSLKKNKKETVGGSTTTFLCLFHSFPPFVVPPMPPRSRVTGKEAFSSFASVATKDALRPMASGKEMWEYHGISPFPEGFSIAMLDCQRVVISFYPG